MKPRRKPTPEPVRGSIRADEVLTLTEFVRRLGIGQKTWRSMKAAGLQSALIGKRRYILGRHVVAFIERLAENGEGKCQ